MNWEIIKTIFVDGQLLGIIIGSVISFFFYKIAKSDSQEIQKSVWRKEFDRYQTEPIIEIFRNILSFLNNNAVASIKSSIPQEHLSKLKIELQLVRYFNDDLKEKINKGIYKECLDYNEIGIVKNSTSSSTTEPTEVDKIANESRVEKEKREMIEKSITEVIDKIKTIYSEF